MRLKASYKGKRHDYHAHTRFSDGALTVKESIEKRLPYASVIGISDHYRYLIAESGKLDVYNQTVKEVISYFGDIHNHALQVKLGVEIFLSDIQSALKNLIKYDFDFIIIENFEYSSDQLGVIKTIENLISSMKAAGHNPEVILAHPDYNVWLAHLENHKDLSVEKMFEFINSRDISIEINVNKGYFFRTKNPLGHLKDHEDKIVQILMKNDVQLSIGTDSHFYEDVLFRDFLMAYDFFDDISKPC